MKKISFIALLIVCAFFSLEAQNEMQALRYSQYNPFGTARYAAQGGAIGALGGDLSSRAGKSGRTWILPFFGILFLTLVLLGEYNFQIYELICRRFSNEVQHRQYWNGVCHYP